MERQITISVDEYNKLIDEHTKREELPEKIDLKKISSKWFNWLKRVSYSLLHYNKSIEQQKLIKRCIEETASEIRANLYGYWRNDLSDYFKDGNFDVSLRVYKDDAYRHIMEWLDKKKQRMEISELKIYEVYSDARYLVITSDKDMARLAVQHPEPGSIMKIGELNIILDV